MPPRLPLPRLTLYTGGKECSLCEVAKRDLASVYQSTPFHLVLWNIRAPPEDASEREAKKWRRLYQYDITQAHLAAGGMEVETDYDSELDIDSGRASKRARYSLEDASTSTRSLISSLSISSGYRPYHSVLTALPSLQSSNVSSAPPSSFEEVCEAPWRLAVGAKWMSLDSEYGTLWGEDVDDRGGEMMGEIIQKMFSDFSSPNEWQAQLEKWRSGADTQEVHAVQAVCVLEESDDQAAVLLDVVPGPVIELKGGIRANQTCWNCQQPGHALISCSAPRNPVQIQLSREIFFAEKEAVPPAHMAILDAYVFDEEERERRLDLSRRFRPGKASNELLDAFFHVDIDAELTQNGISDAEDADTYEHYRMEELRVQRKQGKVDWLLRIAHWGYPPGWIAGHDPQALIQKRLTEMSVSGGGGVDSDDEDMLEVYGDDSLTLDPAQIPILNSPASTKARISTNGHGPGHASTEYAAPPPPHQGPPPPPPPPPNDNFPPPPPSSGKDTRNGWTSGGRAARQHRQPAASIPMSANNPYHAHLPARQRLPTFYPPPTRWARYETNLFDNKRLQPFSSARPLPLGF